MNRAKILEGVRCIEFEREFVIGVEHGGRVALAASIILAAVLAGVVSRDLSGPEDENRVTQEVVDAHRRSLSTGSWTEFASSDQRAIASWASDRRVGFSPPIADLGSEGYALLGGRHESRSRRKSG